MKFGVFSSTSVPKPWTEGKEARLFRQEIDMAVKAEEAGFDYYWAPEHHFLEEYSHCSASDMMVLAVGMRTTRIRLATGIFNLCPPINHPIRVAERTAMIDVLTNGRVDLGTGRGSGSWEVNGFGVSTDESRAMWDEAIRAIPQMWQTERFSWQGKYFSVPERNVLPKPVQKPHPPLWVTSSNPESQVAAASMGLGLAVFSFGGPDKMEPTVERYKKAIAHADPVGAFVTNQVMTITSIMCLEDGDEARRIYLQNAGDRGPYFARYFDSVREDGARRFLQEQGEDLRGGDVPTARGFGASDAAQLTKEQLIQTGACVGDPDDVIEALKLWEASGIDMLVLVPITGFSEPFEKTIESIETFGKHVLPRFRKMTSAATT